jgi:hypothetical protein
MQQSAFLLACGKAGLRIQVYNGNAYAFNASFQGACEWPQALPSAIKQPF